MLKIVETLLLSYNINYKVFFISLNVQNEKLEWYLKLCQNWIKEKLTIFCLFTRTQQETLNDTCVT